MTQPNRLQLELDEIVATGAAASTGQETLEALDVEAAPMVFFDSIGVGDSVRVLGPSHAAFVVVSSMDLTNPSAEVPTAFQQLKDRVSALEEEVAELRASLANEDVIELREISRGKAKQEILELFQNGETLFYSDLAERLRIDLPLVVEICQELEKEGEIEVNADAI